MEEMEINAGIGRETIRIKYIDKDMPKLEYIDGEKSDWIDLRSAETITMLPGDYRLIHLGVAMELPNDYEAHIAPRSSTFKKFGVIEVNSLGIVDNSFCGDDDWWRFPALAMRQTTIHRGDRICQFRIVKKQPRIEFREVDSLRNPSRGGFGSTGVN